MATPEINITSPIDDSQVGTVPAMSADDVSAAIATAKQAQPEWAAKELKERLDALDLMAGTLRSKAAELATFLTKEVGKTPDEAMSEVIRSAELIEYTIIQAKELKDEQLKAKDFPNTKSERTQSVTRVPWGVVLAIGPFNYPINLTISKIAPALAMGNTVVFKPPTQGAATGRLMVDFFREAGLDEPLLQVVTGHGGEIGDRLVTHPDIAMIAMTGSTKVGLGIAEQTTMKPLMLELGGNDAAIVLADADLDLAATHIVGGAFKYSGQRCTAVKRVYVDAGVADDFVHRLLNERNKSFGSAGDPRQHPVGPVISDDQVAYLNSLLEDAKLHGGTVVCGGGHQGRAFEATIVDKVPAEAKLVTEEQFGPILPIVRVADADEAVRLANDSEYGLQASVFTKDTKQAERIAAQLEVGGVHINGPDQRGPDNFMFVGHKKSGITPQGVRFALEGMSQRKGIVHNP